MDDIGLPRHGSRATLPAEDWAPMPASPGWSVRPLLATSGFSTQLMRVEPGTITPPHAHETTEQVYVLDGSLYDADGTQHKPGTFIVRAAGAMHGGGSRDGATLLVIYGDVG